MLTSKAAIMITLFFSTSQGKNHICYSSINAVLDNLLKYHKISIKRRWCFECFRWLEMNGYIKRSKRYRNEDNGVIRQIPSMIVFRLKGIVQLVKMGVKGAKELYKSMMKYIKSSDKRFPNQKDFNDGSWEPEGERTKGGVAGLLGIVTKNIN